jgi:hypothetical protein
MRMLLRQGRKGRNMRDPNDPQTGLASGLPRPFLGFLIVASVALVVDITICVVWGPESEVGTTLWWAVNFPSLPCVFGCLAVLGPPPMGEAQLHPWDYLAFIGSFIASCFTWGLIGAYVGWKRQRPATH